MAEKPLKKTLKTSQIHLSHALEEWSTISQTVKEEGKIAPDQKMLKEIEGLLLELKSKLEEFSAPDETTATAPIETTPMGTAPSNAELTATEFTAIATSNAGIPESAGS